MDEIVVLYSIHVLLGRLKSLVGVSYFMQDIDALIKHLEHIASMIGRVGVYRTELSLRNLQEVIFEVDDLVDDMQIMYAQYSLKGSFRSLLLLPFRRIAELHDYNTLFRTLIPTLVDIEQNLEYATAINNENKSRTTDSVGGMPLTIWRERVHSELLHLILQGEASVIYIVGPIGFGKTALAQSIFFSEKTNECFSKRVWIVFGGDSENVQVWNGIFRRDVTREELKKIVKGQTALIVLDACYDKASCGSYMREMLDLCGRSSVIIVTTTSRFLASGIEGEQFRFYQLERLSLESSDDIIRDMVSKSGNFHNDPGFENTLREIVELCYGVPLILSKVGELLTNGTLGIDGVLARLKEGRFDEIMENFSLCYSVLPPHLRLPFHTLFLQKACGISVEALKCLWMALGFLNPQDSHQHLVNRALTQPLNIGKIFLQEFADTDLSPKVEYAPGGVIREIRMDDHIYSLSLLKARNQWVMMHDSSQSFEKTARYIIWDEDSLPRNAVPRHLLNAKKARLFILHTKERAPMELVSGIISALTYLRVLGLGGCDIEKLPSSIDLLKYLRYLDLGRNTRLKKLPHSVSGLCLLQTLFLHGCEQLQEVPAWIGRLKNLMYLTLTTLNRSLPEEIGQLVHLQTLGLVGCQRLASLPKSIKKLNRLQTLAVLSCPELDLAADSSVEGLKGNESIETLILRDLPKFEGFSSDLGTFCVAMKHLVIQSCVAFKETMWIKLLKPLRSLTIESCREMSVIMDGIAEFDSLLELVIRDCSNLGNMAWITQFKFLRSLIINGCPKLVALDSAFSNLKSLQRLEIKECPELTGRCVRRDGEDWHLIEHVPLIELDGQRA